MMMQIASTNLRHRLLKTTSYPEAMMSQFNSKETEHHQRTYVAITPSATFRVLLQYAQAQARCLQLYEQASYTNSIQSKSLLSLVTVT